MGFRPIAYFAVDGAKKDEVVGQVAHRQSRIFLHLPTKKLAYMFLLGLDLETGDAFNAPLETNFITEVGLVLWDTEFSQPVDLLALLLKPDRSGSSGNRSESKLQRRVNDKGYTAPVPS